MELLCSAVVLVLVIVAIVLTVGLVLSRGERPMERAYRQLARRFRGQFSTSGWLSGQRPMVQFRYRDIPVKLETYDERGVPHTSLTFTWPGAYVGAALVSRDFGVERFVQGHRTRPSVQLIPTRTHPNDAIYAVTFRPDRLEPLLSAGVVAQIARIHEMGGGAPTSIVLAPPLLAIHKRVTHVTLDDLTQFVRLGVELLEQMRLTQTADVDFVDDGSAQVIDQAECQVCGEQIEHDLVVCRRCKTPHHRDCWEYAGGCSIYGCGEQRYERVES